jgi:hypothetical protein
MDPFDARRDHTDDGTSGSGRSAEEEKRLAVEQACEIFGLRAGLAGADPRSAGPITEEDRNLIIWNIEELFLV